MGGVCRRSCASRPAKRSESPTATRYQGDGVDEGVLVRPSFGDEHLRPGRAASFRAYSRSGWVIHCLARRQLTPKRWSAWWMVSPLTCRGLRPMTQLTWAARSSVHRLVGWPNSRGPRRDSAHNCSARSPANARGGGWWGGEEPCWRAARPWALKACSASSIVWSSQPTCAAMRGRVRPVRCRARSGSGAAHTSVECWSGRTVARPEGNPSPSTSRPTRSLI
jgi:hypothetical protein